MKNTMIKIISLSREVKVFSTTRFRCLVAAAVVVLGITAIPVQIASAGTPTPTVPNLNSDLVVHPAVSTCFALTQTYTEHYTLNNQKNLCVKNSATYTCTFSVIYGNIFTVAYASIRYNSGYCTITYPYHGVIVYYEHTSS